MEVVERILYEELDESFAAFETFRDCHDYVPGSGILPAPLKVILDTVWVDDSIDIRINLTYPLQNLFVD